MQIDSLAQRARFIARTIIALADHPSKTGL